MKPEDAERVVREFERAVTAAALPGGIAPEVYLALHLSVVKQRNALLAALTEPAPTPAPPPQQPPPRRWWQLKGTT